MLKTQKKECTQINMVQRIIWYWISYFADFWSLSAPPPTLAKRKINSYLPASAPRGRVIKADTFSDLNRSSSHRCGFEPSSGHMWDKPSSACGWSGGFSRGSPVFAHLMIGSAQNEWNNLDGTKLKKYLPASKIIWILRFWHCVAVGNLLKNHTWCPPCPPPHLPRNVRQLWRSTMTFSLNIKHADYNLKNTFGLVHWALISPIKFAAIRF